jgi:hypothetical protein
MNSLRVLVNAFIRYGELLALAFRLKKNKLSVKGASDRVWLVEAVEDSAFLLRFYYYLLSVFQSGEYPRIIWIYTKINFNSGKSIRSRLMDSLTQGAVFNWLWKLIYRTIVKSDWIQYQPINVNQKNRALSKTIFESLTSKESLEALEVNGIRIGDLIYDTFLRFKPAPTVDIRDPLIEEIISFSLQLIDELQSVISENRVSHVVSGYVTYIQHGILSRVAINEGLKTFSFGAFNQLIVQPTRSFPYQRRHFFKYKEMFNSVDDPEVARLEGKKIIQNRLSGKSDHLTFYMKKSSFEPTIDEISDHLLSRKLDSRPKVVIMGHDFFDSPHIYGRMLYPDFYEWVVGCLSMGKDSPFQFLYKPHPNSVTDENNVLEMLKEKFPEVVFLSKEVSNRQIMTMNIMYVITVYGTVAYEFAANGFRVLCCGENPHQTYGFSHLVESRDELKSILCGLNEPRIDISLNEIYEYVYLHNYRLEKGELSLFPWSVDALKLPEMLSSQEKRLYYMKNAIQNVNNI